MTTIDTPIADQVILVKQGAAEHLPAEVRAVFDAQVEALTAAGIPPNVADVGTVMPDGDLLDAHGGATTLEKARGGKPAVVVFYRGDWCPYCNVTLRSYQAGLVDELTAQGVELIAISPQRPDGALSMQEKNDLKFAVVSDPGNQIGGQLGILISPSAEVSGAQQRLGLDVAAGNADGTDTMPMPTVVLIDATGVIRWIDVHPDFTTRTEPGEILAALAATVKALAPQERKASL